MISMTILEWLVLVFIFIEAGQLYKLIQVSQKQVSIWEEVLHDPEYAGEVVSNALFGFMDKMNNDEEKRNIFYGFVATCAINGAHGIKEHFGGGAGAPGVNLPKRHAAKPFESIINAILPGLLDKAKGNATKAAKDTVESAIFG